MNANKALWKGEFEQISFEFEGRKAIVVKPSENTFSKKWILKTEYFDAFQDLEYEFVKNGYTLAYVANRNRWGAEIDLDLKMRFCEYVIEEFGLESKGIPIGMSCGGMIAIKFAAKYPRLVRALYLDAPVINLLSCPCGLGVGTDLKSENIAIALRELDMHSISDMLAYRNHPLDNIPALLEYRIPVALVCGVADTTVPFAENGFYIKNAYENSDIPFKCFLKEGAGHHPHGPGENNNRDFFIFLDEQ